MSDLDLARTQPARQLWDELGDVHAGMLGVVNSGDHMQPMAPQLDPESNTIWFFTRRDSDLLKSVGHGAQAHFCVVGKNHDFHGCMIGVLRENKTDAKIEQFWSPVVAAWYSGKDDPNMTMMEFQLDNAMIWASVGNPITFGWEIAKANLSDSEPHVGVTAKIEFNR